MPNLERCSIRRGKREVGSGKREGGSARARREAGSGEGRGGGRHGRAACSFSFPNPCSIRLQPSVSSTKPMNKLDPPETVRGIVKRLEGAGYQTWWVGGAVRDAPLGDPPPRLGSGTPAQT